MTLPEAGGLLLIDTDIDTVEKKGVEMVAGKEWKGKECYYGKEVEGYE